VAGVLDGVGAVQQGLAAQPCADGAGFVGGQGRGVAVTSTPEVLGMIEEAMGEMVGHRLGVRPAAAGGVIPGSRTRPAARVSGSADRRPDRNDRQK
jgi:hypothetical protein